MIDTGVTFLALAAAFLPLPVALPAPGAAGPLAAATLVVEGAAARPASPELSYARAPDDRVRIPAGAHVPFYGSGAPVAVAAFELDRYPVSQGEFAAFVRTHPQWRRDRLAPAFAGDGYLRSWPSALEPVDAAAPVVDVSWFAARAFCASIDARLPTMVEWEYVAAADATRADASADPAVQARLLEIYTRPLPPRLPGARAGEPNWFGVHGMHGTVREWVLDFNSILISDDSRGADNGDRSLYCAAAASGARDAADYAAFLRHAYRASLGARATQKNLGFRCARSIP